MRADYRIYSEEAGFIKNVFEPPKNGFTGNIFLAVEILGFFRSTARPNSVRIGGFRSFEELLSDMAGMGFGEDEVREQVHTLVKYKMLAYDGEDTELPADGDLIKITPSGFIHLRSLPHFIEYISSIALYLPFEDAAVAKRVAAIWERAYHYGDVAFSFKHEIASMVADYLVRHKNRLDAANPIFKERSREAEGVVRAMSHIVNTTANIAASLRAKIAAAAKVRAAAAAAAGKPDKRSGSGARKRKKKNPTRVTLAAASA